MGVESVVDVMMPRLLATVLLATSAVAATSADDSQSLAWKRIRLPDRGSVLLQVPPVWRIASAQANEAGRPTIEFRPIDGDHFVAHVSILWRAADDPFKNKELLRWVKDARDVAAPRATTKIPILAVESGAISGYYFTAIDKAPKPGEKKYMTHGSVLFADVCLTFTALSHDPTQPEDAGVGGLRRRDSHMGMMVFRTGRPYVLETVH